MARLAKAGTYSVIETNHLDAVRTGAIKAQYPLADSIKDTGVENGMLLMVDDVKKEVTMPTGASVLVYLHASEERIYEDHLGRNSFILKSPNLPRMFKLAEGDIFETNAVTVADADDYAAEKLLKHGIPSINGDITLTDTAGSGAVILDVVEWVTLPNGEPGVKFAVVKA